MQSAHVLIVEDEFLIRMTLSEALLDEGFEVTEAATGDEALRLVGERDQFDLLLTDVQLPGVLNGVELARAARARYPTLPVIFVTGRPDSFSGRGNDEREVCIAKPYLPSEICEAARRLTRR